MSGPSLALMRVPGGLVPTTAVARASVAGLVLLASASCSSERPSAAASTPTSTTSAEPGCSYLQEVPSGDRTHLAAGEAASYETYPPTGGRHDANVLQTGWYDDPWVDAPAGSAEASLAKAVHSLEHGYVAVLYRPGADVHVLRDVWDRSAERRKLLIAPAAHPMHSDYALLAWERVRWCSILSSADALEFFHAYREAGSAPEPEGP